MKTQMKASLMSSVFLVLGCAELDRAPEESVAVAESSVNGATFRFIEGGPVPYVLGYSPETGQILGGSHQLLLPRSGGREANGGRERGLAHEALDQRGQGEERNRDRQQKERRVGGGAQSGGAADASRRRDRGAEDEPTARAQRNGGELRNAVW